MIRKLCLALAVMSAASFSMVSAQQAAKVTASGIGYLEYLPQGYHSSSSNYPLVISLHGIREKGTTSTDRNRIIADLAKVDNVGLPKYVKYGQKYPFILISPQLKSNMGQWTGAYIMQVINHVKKHLRVDDRRIYLTGLSLGGFGVWRAAGEYPEVFAAIAPICPGGNALSKAHSIAAKNLPAWGFHGSSDKIVSYTVTTKMINAINGAPRKPNPLAKATIFPGMGHTIWDKAYNQTNVLNWMLSHRKGSAPAPQEPDDNDDDAPEENTTNKPPVARAGADRTITLPANSLYIQGSASDEDGKVVSIRWTKVSGGSVSLGNPSSAKFRAYNLKEGNYVFRMTVKDNDGASRSDDMSLTVKGSSGNTTTDPKPKAGNQVPIVSAGPDRVITLPQSSITIAGKATDRDGKIVSLLWEQTYGKRVNISGASTSQATFSGLTKGAFIFRLRAKDNDGAVKDDYFKITVKAATGQASQPVANKPAPSAGNNNGRNVAPRAYAGPDRIIVLPNNSITIQASASDKDGSIVSYEWAKTYGNSVRIQGQGSSKAHISNLRKGVYIFRLRVKDNDGAVHDDYFKITVKSSGTETASNTRQPAQQKVSTGNARPVALAGPDRTVRASQRSIVLKGSARDSDGRVVSYHWKKLSGPSVSIDGANSPQATITDLKAGRYYFSLTVKDDDNAVHVDKMLLRVNGS